MQIIIPQVAKTEAENFSKLWTHNGLAIVLNDVHFQFATDFCNVVLRSLAEQQVKQIEQNQPQQLVTENA